MSRSASLCDPGCCTRRCCDLLLGRVAARRDLEIADNGEYIYTPTPLPMFCSEEETTPKKRALVSVSPRSGRR